MSLAYMLAYYSYDDFTESGLAVAAGLLLISLFGGILYFENKDVL